MQSEYDSKHDPSEALHCLFSEFHSPSLSVFRLRPSLICVTKSAVRDVHGQVLWCWEGGVRCCQMKRSQNSPWMRSNYSNKPFVWKCEEEKVQMFVFKYREEHSEDARMIKSTDGWNIYLSTRTKYSYFVASRCCLTHMKWIFFFISKTSNASVYL